MKKVGLFAAAVAVLVVAPAWRSPWLPSAQAQIGLPPILPPLPPPDPICIGPICVGLPVATISLGPVALPIIPTGPLPPIFPPPPPPPEPPPPPPPPPCNSTDLTLKVLVISADGKEADLPAIQQALDYHSVPYTTWIATQNPGQLTADKLAGPCGGNYQGVILTTGGLAFSPDGGVTFASALSDPEWAALRSYEARLGVREISWFTFPGAAQGMNPPSAGFDTTTTPVDAALTAAGQAVFPYVNTANPVTISMAWTYLATPADANVTPLLADAGGHALISTRKNTDGRETMTLTFDSNPFLVHDVVLAHGLVEWVTRGIYLGEYRAYLTPQEDDLFIDDDMYSGGVFRITATDVSAMNAWQAKVQSSPGNSGFRLAHAFNGVGGSTADPLTVSILASNARYHFINHTFTHENLDSVDYATAFDEIDQNIAFAQGHALLNFSPANLVTPDVSGLSSPAAMQAAADLGVRYTVSDTSRAGWDNPKPNVGIYSTLQPTILHVPRRPTNLFYNVAVPTEWTAEYNSFYATFWGRNLTYAEILDKESQFLLFYMLRGDLDPQMYHQPNLRAYDGVHSLLSDLHDLAIQKYRRYSTLPVVSPDMHVSGRRMANTMARNASGLTAILTPGVSVSFSSPVAVEFALSGVCTLTSERYAGKCITTVDVPAGGSVTVPVQ
jgi:hypothetical protein